MTGSIINLGEVATGGQPIQLKDFIDRKYANLSGGLGAKLLIKGGRIRVNAEVVRKPKHLVNSGDFVVRDSFPFALTSPASRVMANKYLERFEGAGGVETIPVISARRGNYDVGGSATGSIDLPSAAVTAID